MIPAPTPTGCSSSPGIPEGVPRAILAAALGLALLAGCGDDAGQTDSDLRSDRLIVLDWSRADPSALCETENVAKDRPGRTVLRSRDAPSGEECWVAIRPVTPVATGSDVEEIVRRADGQQELRFTDEARRRIAGLGSDAHVGVVDDGRLLTVIHPAGGRVRLPE